jgi:hypothetical protein
MNSKNATKATVKAKHKKALVPGKPSSALAAQIKKQHGLVLQAFREGLDHARKAGELLLKAKEQCSHGEWTPWIEGNCGFNIRTAQQYMQIAEGWDEIRAKAKHVSHLPMRDALKLLAKPKEAEPNPGPDQPNADADKSNDSPISDALASSGGNAEVAESNDKATGATVADPKRSTGKQAGPRRVFNEPPYSSETHFKVKIEVVAHLRGFHCNDNPELTAEEIQEKLASGEMVITESSLGFGGMSIITKEKRKTKAARFGDLRDALFKVVSIEAIEGVPENWEKAQEFFRNWKPRQ